MEGAFLTFSAELYSICLFISRRKRSPYGQIGLCAIVLTRKSGKRSSGYGMRGG